MRSAVPKIGANKNRGTLHNIAGLQPVRVSYSAIKTRLSASVGVIDAVCFTALFLAACSSEKQPVTTIQDVDDPAMAAYVAESSGDPDASPGDSADPAPDNSSDTVPTHSVVDLDQNRVFLPGRGWLSADEFALIYNERPEVLPGDLDYYAAHQLLRSQFDPQGADRNSAETDYAH